MAVAGWVRLLAAVLSLAITVAHNHSGEAETYRVSAGHLFLLRCPIPAAHSNVTWSRGATSNLSLPTGVEVREGLLWFLPVQTSHNGTYTCQKRGESGLLWMTFRLSVSSGECPDPSETVAISEGVRGSLPCKQREILRLNDTKNIRWMKECHPVQPLHVDEKGLMRLHAVSEREAGKYTCLIDLSVNGRTYTAARSIQLKITNDTAAIEPYLVSPHNEVRKVEVGMTVELKCLALIGVSEDHEVLMWWTVDGTYAEDYEELSETWTFIHNKGRVYRLSTLTISEVRPQFLDVPIYCYISSSVGEMSGSVWLQQADHSALYTSVALCLTASLALLSVGAAFLFFKVDLVLAYRKLLRHFSKQHAPDGKLYDGYVSFLHSSSLSFLSFALQILPEELEKKHGYSLYIKGRDDCPGEALHDVIAATVCQCRRLIIILSPETYSNTGKTQEASSLCDDQMELWFEQKVGLHDALLQNDPRVILVEIDGPVDYSHLPESLRYIKRRQGALKWKTEFLGTHKLTQLCSNRNFWKNLRYHMPSAPAGRHQTVL